MNYLWMGMMLIGIVYGAFTGNMNQITEAVLASAKEAVSLAIAIAGVTAFWNGMMTVAARAGIVESMTRKMQPVMRFLFPNLPGEHPAVKYMATNMIANVLGLGWAATPAGLKAMEELSNLKEERREEKGMASEEMCTFLVLNISSLQLIPVNIIAYRSQYGSINPTAIVGPGIVATAVSTLVAVVFCKAMTIKSRK
ncbi:MAG: nucleoside recognition protein [Lachnospiraceae bacterium]|nr:nucleoside recognition protein [Lachnospiraceae bacterium]